MTNPVQALRALQEIDRHLYRVRAELARLPAERERRRKELDALAKRLEEDRGRTRELQVRVKEIENVTATQRDRIRKLEKETSSSRDMAVVEACRYEIRSLRRQIEDAESEALGLMEQIEGGQERARTLEEELTQERETLAEYEQNVASEVADAQGRCDSLVARRKERLSADVGAPTFALYERLLAARSGEALALLESGICQGCYMEIPRNLVVHLARGTQVIQCPSCDRILYLP